MHIFLESPEQQASLIEGVFAPERALLHFWELEHGVLVSHDLGVSRAQTVNEDPAVEMVKKVKLAHPAVCRHFSWQPVTVLIVVVELSKLVKSMEQTTSCCKVSSQDDAEAAYRRRRRRRNKLCLSDRGRLDDKGQTHPIHDMGSTCDVKTLIYDPAATH